MKLLRRAVLCLAAAIALWLWSLCAWAGQEVLVKGMVLDQEGAGVAGAVISDEHLVFKTGPDGAFSLGSKRGRLICLAPPAGYQSLRTWWRPVSEVENRNLIFHLSPKPKQVESSLVFLADTHLFGPKAQPRRPPPTETASRPLRVWKRLTRTLAADPPALTVVAGDLCADADRHAPQGAGAQMALAARSLARLPQPVRALPGNHDALYPGPLSQGADLSLWRKHLGPARQVYFLEHVTLILLDTLSLCQDHQGKANSCSRTPPQTMAWLDRVLDLLPARTPLMVVTHYPLLSPLAGANPLWGRALVRAPSHSRLGLRNTDINAPAILKLLRGRRVLALINGHEHAFHDTFLHFKDGLLRVVGLPALSGGWWRGDRRWGSSAFAPGYLRARVKEGTRLNLEFKQISWD